MKTLAKIKKLLSPPGPKDLGMSDSNNAMSSRLFSDDDHPTWEDYYERVAKEYPIRYTLTTKIPRLYRSFKQPFTDAWYWFRCHTYNRYHMLDLRQPDYRYGWRDVDNKMLYAIFNLLGEFLNKEKPYDLAQDYTEEEIEADEGMKLQHASRKEAKFLYRWWTHGRGEREGERSRCAKEWHDMMEKKDPLTQEAWKKLREFEAFMEKEEDEMIARLMKIRKTLWT